MSDLVLHILLITLAGTALVMTPLLIGRLVRPSNPTPEKDAIYECGEPTIGSSYIQFDLRFYTVALLFIIFDVEVAFFFPWATLYGGTMQLADNQLDAPSRVAVSQQLLSIEDAAVTPEKVATATANVKGEYDKLVTSAAFEGSVRKTLTAELQDSEEIAAQVMAVLKKANVKEPSEEQIAEQKAGLVEKELRRGNSLPNALEEARFDAQIALIAKDLGVTEDNLGQSWIAPKDARNLGLLALADILVFFGVLLVGFAYVWKRGDLEWVRSVKAQSVSPEERRRKSPDTELVA